MSKERCHRSSGVLRKQQRSLLKTASLGSRAPKRDVPCGPQMSEPQRFAHQCPRDKHKASLATSRGLPWCSKGPKV